MPKITYSDLNKVVECSNPTETLLDISIHNRIPHVRECGGNGQCTTCRVRVTKGHEYLTKPTPLELRIAHKRHWEPSIRLACQCYAKGDIAIQRLLWTSSEVSHLQLEEIKLGDAREQEVAILIGDMRHFTEITSNNLSFDMAHMLNRFYTVLGDPIIMNNGIIYQYVGDEIISIFGISGGSKEKNCKDALRAALGMQFAIERLNYTELGAFRTSFQIGIGINYGKAYIGHLGHPNHRQFAIVGDTINMASRIQEQTKEVNAKILIPHNVYRAFNRETIKIDKWHKKLLKGRDKPDFLYEFTGFTQVDTNFQLQASLDFLLKDEKKLISIFFDRLFRQSPEIAELFHTDIQTHSKIFTHMLSGIVHALGRPEYLSMGLTKLGKSHAHYGVKKEYYPIVLKELISVIYEVLGDHYPEETKKAWKQALELITNQMSNWEQN